MNVVAKVDPRLSIGANHPPPDPTPFDLSRKEIEDLFSEACNWADGSPIENQAQADAVAKLRDDIRAAEKRADERRIEENKPFDDGKAEVQSRYAELIANTKSKKGKTVLAMEALNKALAPWLKKLEDEKLAAAKKAREEADRLAAIAYQKLRDARASEDLEAREQAETLVAEANKAETFASRAENDKAHAKGSGRAVGLRTTYRPEITDMQAFARFVWKNHFGDLSDALTVIAGKLVSRNIHTMDGVVVHEDRGL